MGVKLNAAFFLVRIG